MGALRYSLATSVVACLVTRALVSVLIPVVSCSSYRHGQGSDSYSGTVYLVSFPPCVFVSHSSSSVFLSLCSGLCILCLGFHSSCQLLGRRHYIPSRCIIRLCLPCLGLICLQRHSCNVVGGIPPTLCTHGGNCRLHRLASIHSCVVLFLFSFPLHVTTTMYNVR